MIRQMAIMGFSIMLVCTAVIGEASAARISGGWSVTSVTCEGIANVSNIDKNNVSVACNVIVPDAGVNAILVCMNPGDNVNINLNNAFVTDVSFITGLSGVQTADKKGKTTFLATSEASGTQWTTTLECDADPNCVELRKNCKNNNWVPIDVILFSFTGVMSDYYCDSDGNHQCACDPNIPQYPVNPDEAHRCATNLGGGNPPWSFNWDLTGGVLVPLATATYDCTLPDPQSYSFGEKRAYDCTLIQ